MSAINIIVQRDAAHVICDGARYTTEGVLNGIGPKCEALPHLPALIASRGLCQAIPIVLYHIAWKFPTFDALLAGIEVTLGHIVDSYGDFFKATGYPEIELFFVGYSAAKGRFGCYMIQTHSSKKQLHAVDQIGGVDMDDAYIPEPFELTEINDAMITPCLPKATKEEILNGRDSIDQLDPIKDGMKILAAQRALKMSLRPGGVPIHLVGGLAMASTVTRTDATQRIIHRWKEDRIGELITPVASNAAPPAILLANPGMSKLQRDMLERKQRKALRRVG